VTWIQFNAQLLRLTGEARFAEELERSVYNQLLGAQKPDGSAWGYYVQLEGKKPYSAELSGHCCLSSGPRGVSLIPTFAVTTDDEGVVMNFFAAGHSKLKLRDGQSVEMEVSSRYPADGKIQARLRTGRNATFTVKMRIPAWSQPPTIVVNGRSQNGPFKSGDYAALRRKWRDGDTIDLTIPVVPRLIVGEHGNRGKVAFAYGPLILAADDALNPDAPIGQFEIPSADLGTLAFQSMSAPKDRATSDSARIHSVGATLRAGGTAGAASTAVDLRLVPFADAGSTLAPYQVWLPCGQTPTTNSTTRVH
jgi:DUF1680 family protein